METIEIEANMAMGAVGAPVEAKRDMAGDHFLLPVPVSVATSEDRRDQGRLLLLLRGP